MGVYTNIYIYICISHKQFIHIHSIIVLCVDMICKDTIVCITVLKGLISFRLRSPREISAPAIRSEPPLVELP